MSLGGHNPAKKKTTRDKKTTQMGWIGHQVALKSTLLNNLGQLDWDIDSSHTTRLYEATMVGRNLLRVANTADLKPFRSIHQTSTLM